MAEKTTTSTGADPKEIFRLGSDSKEILSDFMQYDNDWIWQGKESNAVWARYLQMLKDQMRTQQMEVQTLREKLNRQQQANARALNSVRDLGYVTGSLVAILYMFYAVFAYNESG